MSNLTDNEIRDLVSDTSTTVEAPPVQSPESNKIRGLLLVGCGDGGCNIAMEIASAVPEAMTIAYNTSSQTVSKLRANWKIFPAGEDGSGKAREYSQELFKSGPYKHLLKAVQAASKEMTDLSYIVVTTTCDGGTGGGVSPMVAKFLKDNTHLPVILVGVYPTLNEDAIAQYNAMCWQKDVEKSGIPYMVFDNGAVANLPVADAHDLVNREVADTMRVIAGNDFGSSTIAQIDSRDILMLLNRIGGRISIVNSTKRPSVDFTLDEHITTLVKNATCVQPSNVTGIGLFVKAPAEYLKRVATHLQDFTATYGLPNARYTHLEEGDEIRVAIICSGCSEPSERVRQMRRRYDDIQEARVSVKSAVADALSGISSPLGGVDTPGKMLDPGQPDLSAFEL